MLSVSQLDIRRTDVEEKKTIRIGGLGPLTLPGIPWAGRELKDGMSLAVQQLNGSGGVLSNELTLLFEDTHGRPEAGIAAVQRLLDNRVHAFAGEFHSVVADAVVDLVQRSGLPFVCASATLDDITARRLGFVFRLAPPQSYGWAIYAEFLASEGFQHVVALQEDNSYWSNGSRAIEARLRKLGVRFTRLSAAPGLGDAMSWIRQVQAKQSDRPVPDILLLLMGYPEPLRSVVSEARNHSLVPPACFLGDPAGRAVFPDWWEITGTDAIQVPFLSYTRPDQPTAKGKRISVDFKNQYGREPTFVAFEGYDSVLVLARAFEDAGTTEPSNVCEALRSMELEGTRGTIKFSTEGEGVVHQQWKWPPVCVVAYSHARQGFSQTDLLWDAEHGRSGGTRSLRRAG
jgi:ABC-type branched-subunit amino acid transport system substrate-binding protein